MRGSRSRSTLEAEAGGGSSGTKEESTVETVEDC